MQKWEIKRHWVPVDIDGDIVKRDNATNIEFFTPTWQDNFKTAWAEAESLSSDGWELVSVTSETKGFLETWTPRASNKCYGAGGSFTTVYMLVFKRPKG